MRRSLILLFAIVFLLSGCSFDIHILTPMPVQTMVQEMTPVAFPSSEPVSSPAEAAGGFTPGPTAPLFYGAYATFNPGDLSGRSIFPAGTKRIYVLWSYQNMTADMTVKREWYLNGRIWLTREEKWDFAKYGAFGTQRDVSIYDLNTGLPSGMYQVQMYIDGIQQPIGANTMFEQEDRLNFIIQSLEDVTFASPSPDNRWSITVYGMKRIVLRGGHDSDRELFTGREISYLTWFADSRHLLFVDRDYSGQQAGSPLGVRDDLYIADVATGHVTLLYKSDSRFLGLGGPQPALDGRYISGLLGSGYGDACFVDSRMIFFEVAGDFKSVLAIEQKSFSGIPSAADGVVYPAQAGEWREGGLYAVVLNGTCGIDQSLMGTYLFDVPNLKAARESAGTIPAGAGDLGYGPIHGVVRDAISGGAIPNATVTCQHSSYTSPVKCSGSVASDATGFFVFQNIFFHDTDTIKLTVSAPGYQTEEVEQSFFTWNEWKVDVSLKRSP